MSWRPKQATAALVLFCSLGCAYVSERGSSDWAVRKHVDNAVLLMRSGELDRAERQLMVAKRGPESLDVVMGFACLAYLRGQLRDAESGFRRVLRRDSEYVEAMLGLALVSERQGKTEDARRWYQTALRLSSTDGRLLNNLAVFLVRAGEGEPLALELLAQASVISDEAVVRHNLLHLQKHGQKS